jgi:hypothetical protein
VLSLLAIELLVVSKPLPPLKMSTITNDIPTDTMQAGKSIAADTVVSSATTTAAPALTKSAARNKKRAQRRKADKAAEKAAKAAKESQEMAATDIADMVAKAAKKIQESATIMSDKAEMKKAFDALAAQFRSSSKTLSSAPVKQSQVFSPPLLTSTNDQFVQTFNGVKKPRKMEEATGTSRRSKSPKSDDLEMTFSIARPKLSFSLVEPGANRQEDSALHQKTQEDDNSARDNTDPDVEMMNSYMGRVDTASVAPQNSDLVSEAAVNCKPNLLTVAGLVTLPNLDATNHWQSRAVYDHILDHHHSQATGASDDAPVKEKVFDTLLVPTMLTAPARPRHSACANCQIRMAKTFGKSELCTSAYESAFPSSGT